MSSQDLLLGNNYIIQWLALQLCNNLKNNLPVDFDQTSSPTNSIFNNNTDNRNLLAILNNNQPVDFDQTNSPTNSIFNINNNDNRNLLALLNNNQPVDFNQTNSPTNSIFNNNNTDNRNSLAILNNNQPVDFDQTNSPTNSIFNNNNNDNSNLLAILNNNELPLHLLNKEKPKTNNIVQNKLTSNGCRFNPMRPQHQTQRLTPTPKLKSCLLNGGSPMTATTTSSSSSANHSNNLYYPTQPPKQTLPAQWIDFYGTTPNPFSTLMASKQNIPPTTHSPTSVGQIATAFKAQPPNVPSSTLLAKLNAVTSRPDAHILAEKLDQKMVALLEAFYAINDNPEPAAIEMIAKRINTTVEAIGDWFDVKRIKTNPNAGPRSPPVKKREGGRVVTFSEYQRSLLEAIFDENNYLHPQEYEELSNLIQVPSRNIKIWFKNRRSKQRLSGRTTTTPHSANNSD